MRLLATTLACLGITVAAAHATENDPPGSPDASERGGAGTTSEAVPGGADPSNAGLVPELEAAPATPQTPEQEVRTLGDYGIHYTTRALQGGAEFYPFAFVMRNDGAIQRIAPREVSNFPSQVELLRTLEKGFADESVKGKWRAIAIVADVVINMPDGRESEAIQLALEHSAGFCRNVFYPYTLSQKGVLSFDTPLSGKRIGRVFTACN